MGKGQSLYKKAKKLIPGGTQLFSKRPEMFLPDNWPAYYKKAKGCEVWDLDGKKYIDMSFMGIGACTLGYADKDIDTSVKKAIDNGSMTTLNCAEEVLLAKELCKIHPWAKMARFARTGGEAVSIAVRIARAKTKKNKIIFCGYHGWHDWYLAANLCGEKSLDGHLLPGLAPHGVPRNLQSTAFAFHYNNIDEFLKLLNEHKSDLAAVVMEPIRSQYPKKGFLERIRKETKKNGIILIFDEVSAGWRLALGGAHLVFGVNPDIGVFAKGMSNGYPMAAVIGTESVMNAAQETFVSSTYWTERIGPTAALATIKKMKEKNTSKYLCKIGDIVKKGWKSAALKNGLNIVVSGIAPLAHFSFDYENSLALKTLFTQCMLEEGFLATTSFYASFAHKDKYINKYLSATDKVFKFIAKALKEGKVEKCLKGPVCHGGFRRLT